MTVRLYSDAELSAVRRAEAVRYRMDAASEAYKALYHALDAIETEDNADALRDARRDICEANSKLMGEMRDIVDAETRRIEDSGAPVPGVEEVNERIRGLRKDLESPRIEGLRCCPMCGSPLTWEDVCRCLDADGVYAAVECPCGFSFASPITGAEDWKATFADAFNRRDGL